MPRNKRILVARSIREWSGGERTLKKPNIHLEKLVAARVNKGMITAIDSADIPVESLQLAKNAKVLFDKTSRRDGLLAFGPTAPNANAVLKMAYIKHPDGSGHTYRFTPSTIHDLQAGVWNATTETVALAGTTTDRFRVANLFDIIAFTNNGANEVQWINSVTNTSDNLIENHVALGADPKFRYCTGFFNRLFLAALKNQSEILLAWTGEYGSKSTAKHGFEDIDTSVNETSGFAPLIDSPDDKSDFITGIFGISNALAIVREKSIWVATKQASATNPVNAYPVVPGIGCDTPNSIMVTAFGLCWLDIRTRSVYVWSPGSTPQPIGSPIERSLIASITDLKTVFGIYDPRESVYSVCVPDSLSSIVQVWSYYFKAQAWTYNEFVNLTSFDDVEILVALKTFDELLGTFDGLTGTFDDLSPITKLESKRIYGFSNGTLGSPSSTADTDLGTSFDTVLISKTIVVPSTDIYVARIVIEYQSSFPGTIQIWYAPDGGFHFPSSFTLGDTYTITVLGKPQIITFNKVIHSRRFAFAIKASNGQFDTLSYEVWVTSAGDVSSIRQVI